MEGVLGCGTYDVIVQERGGGALVCEFPWDTLGWERTLDDTSQAAVSASGFDWNCCRLLKLVRPWRHELAIYRDGVEVWVGPVVEPSNPADQFTIQARDLSAWWDHRLIHDDHAYLTPTDLSVIFEAFSDDAMAPDPSPGLSVSTSPCGVTAVKTVLASQHQMAGQALRDIANVGIDWTAVVRTILAGGLVVPVSSIGTLSDDHFANPPTVHPVGPAQANRWVIRGSGGGAAGDTIYGVAQDNDCIDEDGLLESTASVTTIADNVSAAAAALSRVALTCQVVAVDQAVLAPSAPFGIDDLIPGALADIVLAQTCIPFSGERRLQKVSVSASAQDGLEAVSITLQPPGTTT